MSDEQNKLESKIMPIKELEGLSDLALAVLAWLGQHRSRIDDGAVSKLQDVVQNYGRPLPSPSPIVEAWDTTAQTNGDCAIFGKVSKQLIGVGCTPIQTAAIVEAYNFAMMSLSLDNQRLRNWKESAMIVFDRLDFQKLGKLMNSLPGYDISPQVVPFIESALEALRWYRDEAVAIGENMIRENTDALTASMQVLALDSGLRAQKVISGRSHSNEKHQST